MSGNRGRRLSRRDARRILRGDHTAAGPALRGVLAAASAPTDTGELAGERAAMAAFTASVPAGPATAPMPGGARGSSKTPKWIGAITTRVAATVAAVVLVAGGGLAAVAATGGLPGHGDAPPRPAPTSVVPQPEDTTAPGGDATAPSGEAGSPAPQPTASAGEGGSDAIPSPSPVGLCHAYSAGADHGKSMDNPTFSALIAYAGGKDKIDSYCAAVLAAPNPGDGHAGSHSTPQPSHHPPERR
ncbi:hypothetical protein [Amycolatopsis pigmentata]|uniref:Uncharacterized protein n=1 Tax=Amycolatopsis pigmentata TaxID=450801 RepID=A0ABW5G1P4_9PSEU